MYASRRAFWAVAPRAAPPSLIYRATPHAYPVATRLYSTEASAAVNDATATPSPATADATSAAANQTSPPSAQKDQSSSSSDGQKDSSKKTKPLPSRPSNPSVSIKPAYAPIVPPKAASKPAAKPTTKPVSKPVSKPDSSAGKPAPERAPASAAPPLSKPAMKLKETPTAATESLSEYRPVTFAKDDFPSRNERKSSMDVDWSTSYHGISSQPVSEKQFQALMAPLNAADIEVKPDGIIYLPEIKYRRRLNEAFGPMGWGMIPRGEAVVGDNIVTREYALIVGGRFVAQAQGENQYFSPDQLPSSVEGCKSNALMRCCKDLGIASELWDPDFIRKFRKAHMQVLWVEHSVTNKKRQMWFRKNQIEVAYPWKLSQ